MSEEDPRLGTVLDRLYRLDLRLGVGGVGAVYAAWHLHLERVVAVKLLHPQFAEYPDALERFQREARLLSNLGHPAFVEVYDFGYASDGTAYLVMEMIDGETLRSRVQRGQVLPIGEVLTLYQPFCEAMDQAHRAQVIHRDLKPDNLMLVKGGGLKILDFGMAKLVSEEVPLTADRVVMGTPYYMAPERARGQRSIDARSDIFSMGAILYEALTGRMAFAAETPVAAMYRVIQSPVPRLNLQDADLSRRLDEVIARACAKHSGDRYASAGEMWGALEGALSGMTPGESLSNPPALGRPTSSAPEQDSIPAQESKDSKTKVGVILATLDFIKSTYGESGFRRLCEEYGSTRIEKILNTLPNAWIETSELHELHDTINRLFDDGSLNVMRNIGRHAAGIALRTLYSSFLTSAGPETLVRRAQIMFNTLSSTGKTTIKQLSDGQWHMQIRDDPALTRALTAAIAGWVDRYLDLAGASGHGIEERFWYEDNQAVADFYVTFS